MDLLLDDSQVFMVRTQTKQHYVRTIWSHTLNKVYGSSWHMLTSMTSSKSTCSQCAHLTCVFCRETMSTRFCCNLHGDGRRWYDNVEMRGDILNYVVAYPQISNIRVVCPRVSNTRSFKSLYMRWQAHIQEPLKLKCQEPNILLCLMKIICARHGYL